MELMTVLIRPMKPTAVSVMFTVMLVQNKCPHSQFQCTNSQCIPGVLQCDGVNDCADKTDEANCRKCNVYCYVSSEELSTRSVPVYQLTVYPRCSTV